MTRASGRNYCGRFAPSPTGPLHLGSLIAGLASFLDARRPGGRWCMRMEDLDPPREQAGAARSILNSLQAHGLLWDGEVMWQSRRHAAYHSALAQLAGTGLTFACQCTRKQLDPGGCCRRGCSHLPHHLAGERATRIAVPEQTSVSFTDGLQGPRETRLGRSLSNFTLLRKDGLFAYQLAVVVDDAEQGITDVVRGADLLDSTPRQIFLQQQLGLPTPDYLHVPVITDAEGNKFSKQNHAPALDDSRPAHNLRRALHFLNQVQPPPHATSAGEVLAFAIGNWSREQLPVAMSLPDDSMANTARPSAPH